MPLRLSNKGSYACSEGVIDSTESAHEREARLQLELGLGLAAS